MAKKNSSKTATQESISSSQPRVQVFSKWQGINIAQEPLDYEFNSVDVEPNNWQGRAQSDSQPNFLAFQNNLETTSNQSIETRREPIQLNTAATIGDGYVLTGVSMCYDNYVYCVARKGGSESIWRFKLPSFKHQQGEEYPWDLNEWEQIKINDVSGLVDFERTFTSMTVFQNRLIVLSKVIRHAPDEVYGEMFDGPMSMLIEPSSHPQTEVYGITNAKTVPDPADLADKYSALHPVAQGMTSDEQVARITFTAVWCNKYGTTRAVKPLEADPNTPTAEGNIITVPISPVEFSSSKYISLSGEIPSGYDITGIDIYCTMNENTDNIFCGHVNIEPGKTLWSFNWLGAMMDTTQWTTSALTVPKLNTTHGVDACYMDHYDGRLYFYGGSEAYRLYIGGNPGSELSVATGVGGAFVDIEPGSGQEIRKVLKFKTYNGATVVTLLTYHPNTNKGSRYNLLETNITITNEYASKGYTYEKVDSVVGCSSYYGADTFIDGLYAVNRYGLAFTTKQQENTNNLSVNFCSGAIDPVFQSMLGIGVEQSRLICINNVIYVLLAKVDGADPNRENAPYDAELDNFLLCYDAPTKSWYTYSLFDDEGDAVAKHMIHIDSKNFWEGIGIIRTDGVWLAPTTGLDYEYYYDMDNKPILDKPSIMTSLFTHELCGRTPVTNVIYAHQLEIRFDYLCCPEGLDIWIEGVDYYGRRFKIDKTVVRDTLERQTTIYLRINRYVEGFRLFIQGKAHYRLTHINLKAFQKQNRIGSQFGFDARDKYKGHHAETQKYQHHAHTYHDLKNCLPTA